MTASEPAWPEIDPEKVRGDNAKIMLAQKASIGQSGPSGKLRDSNYPPPCGGLGSLILCGGAARRAGAAEQDRADRVGAAAAAATEDVAHVVQAPLDRSQGAA